MTLAEAIAVLKSAGDLCSAASGVGKLYDWLNRKPHSTNRDPKLYAILEKLPITASANDIVLALSPLFSADPGDVKIVAGHNNGGNIRLDSANVAGGDGRNRGGNVTIKAGDGGANGRGGNITIVGGTVRGGDAI